MAEEEKLMDVHKMARITCNDEEGREKEGGIEEDAKHRINKKERLRSSKAD